MRVRVAKFTLMCDAVQWLLGNSGHTTEGQDKEWWQSAAKHCQKQVYIIANKDLSNGLLNDTITSYQIENIKRILGEY